MSQVLTIVLPVFTIVAIGYIAHWRGVFSAAAIDGLNMFVFRFALPALLFHAMATTPLPAEPQWGFLASYYGGGVASYGAAWLLMLVVFKRDAMTSAVAGFGTVFSNTVLLGIPIILTAHGPAATVPLMMIVSLHAVTWYTLGTICVEAGRPRASAAPTPDSILSPSVLKVLCTIRDTATNVATTPIIWGLMAGLLTQALALPVLPLALDVTGRLGEAGIPAAIFAMGATLARYELKGQLVDMAMISMLKLVLFPLTVWIIAGPFLGLSPLWLSVAVLTAAMPCGVNVYLFANRSGAAEAAASGAVLLSTILGAMSLSVLLVVLPR